MKRNEKIALGIAGAAAAGLIYLATKKKPPMVYTCPYCSAEFATEQELLVHIQTTHPEQPSYICPICGAAFWTEAELNYHIQTVHPEVYTCSICGAAFATQAELEVHIATVHPKVGDVILTVLDKGGSPVAGAKVFFPGGEGFTDSSGKFTFTSLVGQCPIEVQKVGYLLFSTTLTIKEGENRFTITLELYLGKIELSNMHITPTTVYLGNSVIIDVVAWNSSMTSTMSRTVVLRINNVKQAEQKVTLPPNWMETVSFTFTPTSVGNYVAELDGLTGSFSVTEALVCPNCGQTFDTYEALATHVSQIHPPTITAWADIQRINYGGPEIVIVGPDVNAIARIVGNFNGLYVYEVGNGPTVKWSGVTVSWWQAIPTDVYAPAECYVYVHVGKFGTVGRVFDAFCSFGMPPIPYPHEAPPPYWGRLLPGSVTASAFFPDDLDAVFREYGRPPGAYDLLVQVGTRCTAMNPQVDLPSSWYLIRNAWWVG